MTTNISTCKPSIFSKNTSECLNLPYDFVAFSFSINIILGFPANSYILWLTLKEIIHKQSFDVFIFNTSLTEVIFNFSFPYVVKQYYFNCAQCKYVIISFAMILMVGRPLFQTCLCFERYIAVLHPVTFLKFKRMKYRISVSILAWIVIISSSVVVKLGVVDMYDLLMPQYVTILLLEVFSSSMLLKALRRPGPGDNAKKEGGSRDKDKAFRVVQIMLVSLVLTYAPIACCLIMYYILEFTRFLEFWSFCLCFGVMLGFVQPFLYLQRVSRVELCFGSWVFRGQDQS